MAEPPAAPDRIAAVTAGLGEHGYAIVPEFLPPLVIAGLAARARVLDAAGEMKPASIGRSASRVRRPDIRGDRIHWLDAGAADDAEMPLFAALEALRVAVNRELMLGLFEFEGHYALYPPGAAYARHVDRFQDDDARVLSCVLYLNEGWRANDGGELRLHPADGEAVDGLPVDVLPVDVLPYGGTLVAFFAERFPHEVLPARFERLAVTGWFRRRAR